MSVGPPATNLEVVRIAATADLHYGKDSVGTLQPLLSEVSANADVLLIAGDLTDYGLPDEARALGRELTQSLKIPIVAVLGNHDVESGHSKEVQDILRDSGLTILDGDSCEVHGVGIAGAKGFGGGFGRHSLGSWGESIIKQYVQEAMSEALKLETALARLRSSVRLAMLHYAPIRDTVVGEPEEIFPFLGSSRLEEPLSRYAVTCVVHGHAHRGQPEGRTSTGVPVYNVAFPLMNRQTPGRPFRVITVRPAESASPLLTDHFGGN